MIVDRASTPQPSTHSVVGPPPAASGSFAAVLANGAGPAQTRALCFQETGLLGRAHSVAPANAPLPSLTNPSAAGDREMQPAPSDAADGSAQRRPPILPGPALSGHATRFAPDAPSAAARPTTSSASAVLEPVDQSTRRPPSTPQAKSQAIGKDGVRLPRRGQANAPLALADSDGELTITVFAADREAADPDVIDQLAATARRYGYARARVIALSRTSSREG